MKSFRKTVAMTIVLLMMLVFVGIGIAAIYNSNYPLQAYTTLDAADKIKNAQKSGGVVILNSSEVNQLMQIYIKKGISKGKLNIKGVNAVVQNNSITFHAPLSYGSIKMLFDSKGTVGLQGDKIIYTPDYFSIGKLPIPKALVFGEISKLGNAKLSADKSSIKIDKSAIPFDIEEIGIKGSGLYIYVNKFVTKGLFEDKLTVLKNARNELEKLAESTEDAENKQKIQNVINSIDKAVKNPVNATAQLVDKVDEELKSIKNDTNNNIKNIQDQIKTADDNKKKQELTVVSGGLSAAAAQLNTAAQKQIIYMMQNTINKIIENPSYNYRRDGSQVKAMYDKLPAVDKKAFKAALLQNVDPSAVVDLRNAFGL